jgi:hypothetical protein
MLGPCIKLKDGRKFCTKTTKCRKALDRHHRNERNPAWLANEVVYASFANAAALRMPESLILDYQGEKVFGSEVLPTRRPLDREANIKQLSEQEDNRIQLVRALLLDLALLNSDRTLPNILLDEKQLLWFYDHEKALLGDGKRPQCGQGDLGRLDPNTLPGKLHDFIRDYLVSVECNSVVFTPENWDILLQEFQALPLDLRYLDEAVAKMPSDWLTNEQPEAMRAFLPKWWLALKQLFDDRNARVRIIQILKERRFYQGC